MKVGIKLDVIIESPKGIDVDMKTGLKTMEGVADATNCIATAILLSFVPKKQNHKNEIKTSLKSILQNFQRIVLWITYRPLRGYFLLN